MEPAHKGEIDQYAHLALQKQEIEQLMKGLRPAIELLGEGLHSGNVHAVSIAKVTKQTLSIPEVKALLTPAEIQQATVTSESLRITIDH